jgi:hypothetical protein
MYPYNNSNTENEIGHNSIMKAAIITIVTDDIPMTTDTAAMLIARISVLGSGMANEYLKDVNGLSKLTMAT